MPWTNTSHSVSCGIDTNRHEIYIHDPSFHMSATSDFSPYFPEGFLQLLLFACSYYPQSPPGVKTKQTLETTTKTSRENKLPLSDFHSPPWYGTVVSHLKIGVLSVRSEKTAVECATHGVMFFLKSLCMFARLPVEPAEATLTAIEGLDLNLCCYISSSNRPVQIRW